MFFNQGNNFNSNNSNNTNNSNNSLNLNTSTPPNHNSLLNKSQHCHLILRKYFKHESFRENQLEIILNTLSGGDSLVVMATGSGKSLCYQIPPMISKKPAIVVSPLLSLIQNQIQSLQSKGIAAISFTSASKMTSYDYTETFTNATYSIIYITPEGIDSKLHYLKQLYNKHGISCIAIDESHCVSEWGFDFRPAYKKLYKLRDNLPNIPILALTATATLPVRKDIINILKINNSKQFISSFNRTNLTYHLKQKSLASNGGMDHDLCSLTARRHYYASGSTIIYTSTQKHASEIAQLLCSKGISAAAYHGGLNNNIRETVQIKWEQNTIQCICATIAFGMGIDKPDIRYVIHYGMPDSIEAFYQHTGRAGRDGNASECILFWSKGDFSKSDWRAGRTGNRGQQDLIVKQTQLLKQFTYTRECRIKFILRHFGEEFNECKNRCDNCIEKYKKNNIRIEEKDFSQQVKCLVQTCQQTNQRYGINMLVLIAKGKECKRTNDASYVKSKHAWACLKEYSVDWITALSRKTIELGFLGEIWMNNSGGGFRRGYKRIYVTQNGNKLAAGLCSVPKWIPDSDMVKATNTKSKTVSSRKWGFKGNSTPTPRTSAKSSNAWGFKGNNSNRKRSFSEISEDKNSNKKKGNIFSQRGEDSKRRKVSDVIVSANSVNSLMELSLSNRKVKSKPELVMEQTGDDFKQKLISVRKKLATKNGLIAYQVVGNDGIDVLDKYRPSNVEYLKMIAMKDENKKAISDVFINKFGKIITNWIKKYCNKMSLNMDININNNINECKEKEEKDMMIVDEIDINIPIIVPHNDNTIVPTPNIPQITVQSREIYESFCMGMSIENIIQKRLITRETVLNCLSTMVINRYKLDWNRLNFKYNEIKICFNVLVQIGIDEPGINIRNKNKQILGKFTDSEIELLVARYIIDNLSAPKSAKHGKKWTLDDDKNLWNDRNNCVLNISNKYERSVGSIMGRLGQLTNINHKNHRRLENIIGPFGQENIKCCGGHIVYNGNNDEWLDYKCWNVKEDVCLYQNRDCNVMILRQHFGVKIGLINDRLMDLSGIHYGVRYKMLKDKENINNNNINNNNNNNNNENNKCENENNKCENVNDEFKCPITMDVMIDPVLTEDGSTYDREAITEWLKEHNTSPATGVKLKDKKLIPNYNLKSLIEKSQKEYQIQIENEKKIILEEDYNKMILELLNKGNNGVQWNEFVEHLCINDNDNNNGKIKFLKETLQEMCDCFQIYQKNDKYFAF